MLEKLLRRFGIDDRGDGRRLKRVDESPYGGSGSTDVDRSRAMGFCHRDVSEVCAVQRRAVSAHRHVDVESWVGKTERRVVLNDDPVVPGMVGEVDVDREAGCGQLGSRSRPDDVS
jgi:hypothetical protein